MTPSPVACVQAYHVDSAVLSLLLVYACTLPVCWVLFVALRRAVGNRRLKRAADTAYRPNLEKLLGPRVLHGRVITDGPEPAVRVEIDQEGTETQTENTWNHTWTEVDRRVTYRPFRLRLQSGEEVHVEPDASVFLVDSLDEKARRAVDHRTMASELVAGEEAYACGIVHTTKHVDPHAGYRGGMVSHRVLRSPPTGKLLLSTEPLANRFKSRFWFHVRWAIGACLALALLHGVVFFDYHLRVLRGQRVDAKVTQLTITERTGGRARVEHNVIVSAASRGEQYKVDAALRSYSQLAKGTPVELVVVDGWPSATQFGGTVTVNLFHALLSLWCVFIFTHAFVVSREGSKPWYDKKKVIDGGAGRLFETWRFNATPKTR